MEVREFGANRFFFQKVDGIPSDKGKPPHFLDRGFPLREVARGRENQGAGGPQAGPAQSATKHPQSEPRLSCARPFLSDGGCSDSHESAVNPMGLVALVSNGVAQNHDFGNRGCLRRSCAGPVCAGSVCQGNQGYGLFHSSHQRSDSSNYVAD